MDEIEQIWLPTIVCDNCGYDFGFGVTDQHDDDHDVKSKLEHKGLCNYKINCDNCGLTLEVTCAAVIEHYTKSKKYGGENENGNFGTYSI